MNKTDSGHLHNSGRRTPIEPTITHRRYKVFLCFKILKRHILIPGKISKLKIIFIRDIRFFHQDSNAITIRFALPFNQINRALPIYLSINHFLRFFQYSSRITLWRMKCSIPRRAKSYIRHKRSEIGCRRQPPALGTRMILHAACPKLIDSGIFIIILIEQPDSSVTDI